MDRACRLRSFALVRRVRQGGEEVLAHLGVFTLAAHFCCRGVLGFSWMDLSEVLPITPVLGFRRHCHDVGSQHVCVMVLARLSEPTRRGGEEV